MSAIKRSKYWLTMVNILDGQFPKHECKERGQALVLLSYIEMMLEGFKFDGDGRPIEKQPKCKTCYDKGYASQLVRLQAIGDFPGEKGLDKVKEIKNYCRCAKGKRLKNRELKKI